MNAPITLTLHLPPVSLPAQTAQVLVENLTDWSIEGVPTDAQPQMHPLQIAEIYETAQPVDWRTAIAGAGDYARPNPPGDRLPQYPIAPSDANPVREGFKPSPTAFPVFKASDSDITSGRDRAEKPRPDAESWMSAIGQPTGSPYTWPDAPTILALVPHWRCELWLPRALASLSGQSQPLTQIVVIDDASAQPPLAIVQNFPQITLLQAAERVGPYRLIQTVIERTDYDAYLFQDADDWSSGDRLATLLQTARHQGAELVGSQEIRVLDTPPQLQAVGYPLNVNRALRQAPGHALLHPTSLVTRGLVQRLGGFATGLRFGGDTEFVLRAHWQARIVNSPRFCYFRRKRPESLTTDPVTGLNSPARQALTQQMKQRAIAHAQAFAQGKPLDLSPLQTAPPIALHHCWGPPLRWC